jgi:cytochrome c
VHTKILYKVQIAQYLVALTLTTLTFSTSAYAQMDPKQQRGLTFARANCARCHSIDKVTASPLEAAPPFRELHKRYPVETLEEALGEVGAIRPRVSERIPFNKVADAHRRLESGGLDGRLVLCPDLPSRPTG